MMKYYNTDQCLPKSGSPSVEDTEIIGFGNSLICIGEYFLFIHLKKVDFRMMLIRFLFSEKEAGTVSQVSLGISDINKSWKLITLSENPSHKRPRCCVIPLI